MNTSLCYLQHDLFYSGHSCWSEYAEPEARKSIIICDSLRPAVKTKNNDDSRVSKKSFKNNESFANCTSLHSTLHFTVSRSCCTTLATTTPGMGPSQSHVHCRHMSPIPYQSRRYVNVFPHILLSRVLQLAKITIFFQSLSKYDTVLWSPFSETMHARTQSCRRQVLIHRV